MLNEKEIYACLEGTKDAGWSLVMKGTSLNQTKDRIYNYVFQDKYGIMVTIFPNDTFLFKYMIDIYTLSSQSMGPATSAGHFKKMYERFKRCALQSWVF